ncbi:MAG TPA: flagellar hook-associated protein 3 [Lachnospiraceae bacterium]|nr:flagellar hook-associated protein FlgL [uncultured Lachnoclostridium sp.]HAU87788.1 flagellar hook-associated protein 3 [Lachnospiraceae bacterium]
MRVTSKMMNSNALNNINRNKTNLSNLANQYSTQQKIQRPSEDPVVAVRSLKYRTSVAELEQYAKKNVPDAMSWISNTESALASVNEILTSMNTYFNQGANDTLETSERDALKQTLTEYKDQIFQCLNSDYAGRYLFTGYRTDTSLTFNEPSKDTLYKITEPFEFTDIQTFTYVKADLNFDDTTTAVDYASKAATSHKGYKLNLAYDDIKGKDDATYKPVLRYGDNAADKLDLEVVSVSDKDAYDIGSKKAVLIQETGEIILSEDTYKMLKDAPKIEVDYYKDEFNKGEVRPEHYFDCTATGPDNIPLSYQKPKDQQIQYEVNFSQSITVNTLANDCLDFKIINQIDDIINQIERVQKVENKLKDIESKIKNGTYTCSKDDIMEAKTQMENELALEKSVLQEKYGNGITTTTNAQASVNKATADLGSRYKRLELTEARLEDQLTSFNEMLTKNDTVDIEDAIVNYTAALTAYNASLNATAKIAQNSLLDFL